MPDNSILLSDKLNFVFYLHYKKAAQYYSIGINLININLIAINSTKSIILNKIYK
tara:strand:- start:469 stop:633 length:165 start_codon:yes stop_codon:yes gene_type:complete